MAGKKVIIAVLQNFSLDGEDEAIRKFRKKAVVVQNYQGGDVLSDIARIDGATAADLNTLATALEVGAL